MTLIRNLTAVLLWVSICVGGTTRAPRHVRRQDASTTTTESAAPPIPTICGEIIEQVNQGYNLFYASVAFECLVSVPFNEAVALRFIEYYNTTMQFQSTLSYLRNPPASYQQPTVDFAQQLESIKTNVTSGAYANQYAFEADVQHLVQSFHDAHVYLVGGALSAFSFGSDTPLMTLSVDGVQTPEVYFAYDVWNRSQYPISPIVQINGENVFDFLARFASLNVYGSLEPHGDWNQIMYSPVQDILGIYDVFTLNAPFYWGASLNYTLKNDSVVETPWTALYTNPAFTGPLTTGGDYYNYFVLGLLPASYPTNETDLPCPWVTDVPSAQCPDYTISNSSSAAIESWFDVTNHAFPDNPITVQPDLAYGAGGGIVTGYILGDISVGVLSIPSFDELGWDIGNFSAAVQNFTDEAQSENITKIIIDLQGNAGGLVELAFMTFSQFFPQYYPFAGSRRRSHEMADVLGSSLTGYWNGISEPEDKFDYEAGEWVITDRINAETGQNFSSWAEYYGPRVENGDNYSLVEQYDLANVEFDFAAFQEWAPSNYLDNEYNSSALSPWAAKDIVILTDGVCSSTCTLFVELMTQQAGVRTVVVGGRPEPGPMQATSGSRGALAYSGEYLDTDINEAVSFAQGSAGVSSLPVLDNVTQERDSGMYLSALGFNLRDQVRSDSGGPPLQFVYEAADCRLYWTLDNALNMTRLWSDAAGAMWDLPGLNASCVPGSTGYASHGVNITATNPAPEKTATDVASLPAAMWNYDVSPSDAADAGLEDGSELQSRAATMQITDCTAAENGQIAPGTPKTCRRVQVICANQQNGNFVYKYVPPCHINSDCRSLKLFCDTTDDSPVESGTSQQLGPGKGIYKPKSRGYCVPTAASLLASSHATQVGFGCPL